MTNNNPTHTAVRSTRRPLASLAMAALFGFGCLTIAAQAGADPGNQQQAAKYSACMRAHGVADFPNPNGQGQFPYGGISVSPATWVNAVDACKNLQPSDWSGDAGRTPEQQDAALEFAQCVRDNGVPDFPNPATAQDPLIDTTKMRGDVGAQSIPELQPAVDACHDFFTAALPKPLGTGRPG
jgi:hypothetical protein